MIRAICFDLDGVYFTEEWKRGFQKDLITAVWDEGKVLDFLHKSSLMRDLFGGALSPEAFWYQWKRILGLTMSLKEFQALRVSHYYINPEVKELIGQLRNNGYKICTCTNNNAIRIEWLEKRFSFLQDFDVFVASYQVGVFKPDKKIFEELILKAGVAADKIVYTDDNPERLQWAIDLWINTHLYENIGGYLHYLSWLWVLVEKNI
jgi:HAD superfamily hydrolase (TIGR01509 family)